MDLARKVFLRYALNKDPRVVEKSLGKLEGLLKAIGDVPEGQEFSHFHEYTQALDAYRDVLFFLGHTPGGEVQVEHVKMHTPVLTLMSKNPFVPDPVLEELGHGAFVKALAEVKVLQDAFEKAKSTK